MTIETRHSSLAELTATIVAAYVEKSVVPASELPALITSVQAALGGFPPAQQPSKPPAVPIEESITPGYLISLENGRKYRSLKPHLRALGMTADDYRAKWGLPSSYPMVSPNYSDRRSELAKEFGLGATRRKSNGTARAGSRATVSTQSTGSIPQLKPRAQVLRPEDELSH